MFEKKPNIVKSPDLSKLKEVIIDHRTKIYIAPDADIEKARERYLDRIAQGGIHNYLINSLAYLVFCSIVSYSLNSLTFMAAWSFGSFADFKNTTLFSFIGSSKAVGMNKYALI